MADPLVSAGPWGSAGLAGFAVQLVFVVPIGSVGIAHSDQHLHSHPKTAGLGMTQSLGSSSFHRYLTGRLRTPQNSSTMEVRRLDSEEGQ